MSIEKEILDLVLLDEKVNIHKGISILQVDTNMIPEIEGIALIVPEDKNEDRVILNPYYYGGHLEIRTRVLKMPAKKYNKGDVVAKLVVLK